MKIKGLSIFVSLLIIIVTVSSFKTGKHYNTTENQVQDTTKKYRDGVYEGKSQGIYTDEPYWGIVRLTVKDGSFSEVKFIMRDSALHEPFDGRYERHFAGNPEYIQQSRNDWKGVQTYPEKLKGKRSIESVDAMSGATWSYNIFKATVRDALKNSR
jgi:uncharacterized protein with FMN-binding domain